jgi:hypothetical protein
MGHWEVDVLLVLVLSVWGVSVLFRGGFVFVWYLELGMISACFFAA